MKRDSQGNPFLNQHSEEGFVDCVFGITAMSDGVEHYELELQASLEEQVVGMRVLVRKDLQSGFDSEMKLISGRAYSSGVIFRRSGPQSDRLIVGLSKLYGMTMPVRRMIDEETFTAIVLQQGDIDMAKEPVRVKIFGRDSEPLDEDAYYESFFNLDLSRRIVCWNEKDPDYRKSLIQALGAG